MSQVVNKFLNAVNMKILTIRVDDHIIQIPSSSPPFALPQHEGTQTLTNKQDGHLITVLSDQLTDVCE